MQELEFGHHTCTTWDTKHGVKRLDVKMSLRCASSVSVVWCKCWLWQLQHSHQTAKAVSRLFSKECHTVD